MKRKSKYVHSYSSLHEFKTCPHRMHESYIVKRFPYVQSEQAKYGDRVHKAFEMRIGRQTPLPRAMESYEKLMEAIDAMDGTKHPERQLGIKRDGSPCGFFDHDVWFRGKLDLMVVNKPEKDGFLYDYKTGKFNPRYIDADQLLYSAILAFAHHPELENLYTNLLYVAHDAMYPEDGPMIYKRDHFDRYFDVLRRDASDVEDAMDNGYWPKVESPLCGYCRVTDCEFWHDAKANK